jgi:hypothetical protein
MIMTTDLITHIDLLPYDIDQELRRRVSEAGLEDAFQAVALRVQANKATDSAVADAVAKITAFLDSQDDLSGIDRYRELWKGVLADEVRLSRTTLMQIRKSNEFKKVVMDGQYAPEYKNWVQSLDYTSAYLVQKMTDDGRSTAFLMSQQGGLSRSKLKSLSSQYDYAASLGYRRSAVKRTSLRPNADTNQTTISTVEAHDDPTQLALVSVPYDTAEKQKTQSAHQALDILFSHHVRTIDACGALAIMLRRQTSVSLNAYDVLRELKIQVDYLLSQSQAKC